MGLLAVYEVHNIAVFNQDFLSFEISKTVHFYWMKHNVCVTVLYGISLVSSGDDAGMVAMGNQGAGTKHGGQSSKGRLHLLSPVE